MPQTNAERQRAYRARHRGEPRGNPAMQALLAALQARVAQLEVVWRERDELAIQLRQIEAYEPGITEKANAWVEQIDSTPRR